MANLTVSNGLAPLRRAYRIQKRNVSRAPLFLILVLLLSLGYTGLLWSASVWSVGSKEPLYQAISREGGIVLQLQLYVFYFFGLTLGRQNRLHKAEDILDSLSGGRRGFTLSCCALIGKYAAWHAILSMAGTAGIGLYLGMLSGLFAWNLALYTILYFGIPCLILGFMGIAAGINARGRGIYALALAIPALFGLLATECSRSIGFFLFGLRNWPPLSGLWAGVNLGHSGIAGPASRFGLPTWEYLWFWRLGLLAFSVLMVIKASVPPVRTRARRAVGLAAILLFVCAFAICCNPNIAKTAVYGVNTHPYKAGRSFMQTANYEEAAISANSGATLIPVRKPQASSIRAEMDISRYTARLSVEIDADLKEGDSPIGFTLYKDLTMRSAWVNGTECRFERDGDRLYLYADQAGGVTIRLEYSGGSSPFMPLYAESVAVTGDFPWLPIPGVYPANSGYPRYTGAWGGREISFTLSANLPEGTTFCSLPSSGGGVWQGVSRDGVVLLSGQALRAEEAGGITLWYPTFIDYGDQVARYRAMAARYIRLEEMLGEEGRAESAALLWPTALDALETPSNRVAGVSGGAYLISSTGYGDLSAPDPAASEEALLYGEVSAFTDSFADRFCYRQDENDAAEEICASSIRRLTSVYLWRALDAEGAHEKEIRKAAQKSVVYDIWGDMEIPDWVDQGAKAYSELLFDDETRAKETLQTLLNEASLATPEDPFAPEDLKAFYRKAGLI